MSILSTLKQAFSLQLIGEGHLIEKNNKIKLIQKKLQSMLDSIDLLIENEKYLESSMLIRELEEQLDRYENVDSIQTDIVFGPDDKKKLLDTFIELKDRVVEKNGVTNDRFKNEVSSFLEERQINSSRIFLNGMFAYVINTWKRITKTQIAIGLVVLSLLVYRIVYIIQHPEIDNMSTVELYYTESPSKIFDSDHLTKRPVNLSKKWHVETIDIGRPVHMYSVRVDPFMIKNVRFQFKRISLLDENDNVIYNREFKVDQSGLVENYTTLGFGNLLPGKMIPGSIPEMITMNHDPSIAVLQINVPGVYKVQYEIRETEKWNKFE